MLKLFNKGFSSRIHAREQRRQELEFLRLSLSFQDLPTTFPKPRHQQKSRLLKPLHFLPLSERGKKMGQASRPNNG